MPAPRGVRGPGDRKPPRPGAKGVGRSGPRPSTPAFDAAHPFDEPRPFRPVPDHRTESTAGLRHEIIDLRAEVHRLAAEIDKLWARERGRGLPTPGRTARSIAGKPVRTGTRAKKSSPRSAGPAGAAPARPGRPGVRPGGKHTSGATTRKPTAGRPAGGPKRAGVTKRGSGWAKPKQKSRRSGTTPRQKGR